MEQFQFTIIAPAPFFDNSLPLLTDLRQLEERLKNCEIIVATGLNPSRQRNVAIQKARGKFLVFLDCDCRVSNLFFDHLENRVQQLNFEVLGGPALLSPESSTLEQLFQAALATPWITGATAARYSKKGKLRLSDERELILCNLIARKELFDQFGFFDECLYPNEENEWLDRVKSKAIVYYDPDLSVQRSQRKTWKEFFITLFRYGKGRTEQFRIEKKWNAKQLLPFLFIMGVVISAFYPVKASIIGAGGMVCFIILFWLLSWNKKELPLIEQKIIFPFAGISVVVFYLLGQLAGFFSNPQKRKNLDEISLYNLCGEKLNGLLEDPSP